MLTCFGPQATAINYRYRLAAVGDSYVYAESIGSPETFFPFMLQSLWRDAGLSVSIANYGNSGFTTGQVLARVQSSLVPKAIPSSLAIIYAGPNDIGHIGTVQASPAPTADTFSVQAGFGSEFAAGTNIKVGGVARIVQSQSGDAITVSVPFDQAPTAGQQCLNDTTPNLVAIGNALIAKGYTRLMIGLRHYDNFSSGGDTLATPINVPLRAAQQAAADALGASAVVADFYNFDRDRIVAGIDAQGSFVEHIADMNSHRSIYGQQLFALCADASLPPDWRAALR